MSQTIEETSAPELSAAGLTRRRVVQGAACLCALGAMPAWAQEAAGVGPQPGDFLVAKADKSLTPLTVADIDPESKKTVIALALDPATNTTRPGNLAKVLLVRVDPEEVSEETAALSVEGVLAYSAVCTHAGCDITAYRPQDHLLQCPCHGSRFDPTDHGKVALGPAKARLAELGIKSDGGKLVVTMSFDGKVGAQA